MKKSYLIILLSIFTGVCETVNAQSPTIGLIKHTSGGLDNGYVLFSPNSNWNIYMIDKCGELVHSWNSAYSPGLSVYLLPDGNLLRPGNAQNSTFTAGGSGGIIEILDWNSNVVWSYQISDASQCQHHDVKMLPNGNILAIVWEYKTRAEAIAAGRDSTLLGTAVWSEKIVEYQPVGTNSANIVWEWHAWDHLVQDHDNTKSNYASVVGNPQLLDLNYRAAVSTDWLHFNAIDYNPDLDQILFSSRQLDEFYIVDHSTTTAEAASHSGGTSGKGGDFLYRWGNPEAYRTGGVVQHRLFGQHNVHWIEPGLPNAGKIMIFNNGNGRTGGNYSSVDIIDPPLSMGGNYSQTLPYAPDSACWTYHDPAPSNFYSPYIGGTQQLSNGNVLVCNGMAGSFFELDTSKYQVWNYMNPVASSTLTQGSTPSGTSAFRCTFYPASYAGLSGKTLTPQGPIELNPFPNPILATPLPISANTNSGCSAINVALGPPLATDCNVASITNDAPTAFPLGNTVVTWTVTDGSSNNTVITQTVTVTDNVSPIVTAPANITATLISGCTATVSLGTPVTSDNCTVADVTNDAPAAFSTGNTIVTWTVTDASGNTATATQTVTITDNINPTITAPATVTATTNSGCTATAVSLGAPVTNDNCTVANVTNDAPAAFPTGNTIVTWTVTDASGNTATATQTISVTSSLASAQSVTVCAGGFITVGANTYTASGTYTDILTASGGCDSTVTSHLTVENPIDISIDTSGYILTSNASGASYQWIDCANGNAPINGETSQSYTATMNGSYAVVVTVNNCSDTSSCVAITVNAINARSTQPLKIFPNPNSGKFVIEIPGTVPGRDIYIELYDALGKRVINQAYQLDGNNNRVAVTIEEVENGLYSLLIKNSAGNLLFRQNIIKQ